MMTISSVGIMLMALLGVFCTIPTLSAAATTWTLVWSDEFSGSSIDTTYWNVESSSTSGYGGTLQYWTPQNVVLQNGLLRLISKQESMGGKQYTSGALTTKGKMTFSGDFRLEIRAKLPKGQGIWPAMWTREGQMPSPNNGAEMDLMEMLGNNPSLIYMTHHHWSGSSDTVEAQCSYSGPDYSADFHTYTLEIDSGALRWYIDGVQRCGPSTAGLPTQPSHLLLNTSIGGSWPGSPDGTTVFPQYFDIDYVRIYQKTSASPPAAPKNLRKR
jgi:beta-glucanase (GH16 family)